jgi:tRNA threonylcarbamoyladenosine biosynthesis protein TsaB
MTASRVLLALDTSTEWLSVALAVDDVVQSVHREVGQGHAEQTLAVIRELAHGAGVSLRDLDAVAFGSGPGGFTGLRVGCGIAQGLALAADARCIAVSAFEAMAEAMFETQAASQVWIAIDARMSEVYAAMLERIGDRWVYRAAPMVVAPTAIEGPHEGDWVAAGSGFAAYRDALLDGRAHVPLRIDVTCTPRADLMLRLARTAIERSEDVDPALAAPMYLRDRVALTSAQRAAGEVLGTRRAGAPA